jgi:hypothetical protein
MKVEDLIDVEAQERAANGDARFEPNVFLERIEKMANEDPKQFALMSRRRSTTVDVLNIQHVKKDVQQNGTTTAPQTKPELMVRSSGEVERASLFMRSSMSQNVPENPASTAHQEPPLTHAEIVSRALFPAYVPLVRANLAARSFACALVFTSVTGEEFERRGLAD